MCLATFIGTYLPGTLIKKNEGDKLFVFDVTTANLQQGKEFADNIRKLNVPIRTYSTYNNDIEKTLTCKIFCATKVESQLVLDTIPNDCEYYISIPFSN